MKTSGSHGFGAAVVVASAILSAAFYGRLPDPVPTHWGLNGLPDGFTPKPWGAFLFPALLLALWLLFQALPSISPRGFQMERFGRVYGILQVAVLLCLFGVQAVVLATASGSPIATTRWISAGVGLMLTVIGNYMGKVTRNFFVGIRTPWTLASDEVWLRTHRLGGRLFVLAGLLVVIAALAGWGIGWMAATVGAAALVSVLYSYLAYRRIEGRDDPERNSGNA